MVLSKVAVNIPVTPTNRILDQRLDQLSVLKSNGLVSLCVIAKYLSLVVPITLFGALSISAQDKCTQKLTDLPPASEMLGFHLGMMKDEIKAQVPQVVFGRTDEFGISKTTINPDFDPRIDKTRFQGVRTISLDFLDGRLTSLWIGYDSSFKAHSVDDFLKAISESLHVPNAWASWKSGGRQMRCGDFQLTITTVAGGPSFRILDQAAEDIIAARRDAKERQDAAAEAGDTDNDARKRQVGDLIGDNHNKTYYPAGCQPANEIPQSNRVAFKNTEEAEKAGFKAAKGCH